MLNGRKFWNPTPHPTTAASAASNQFNRTATCCVSGRVFRQAGAGKTKVIDDTIRKWGSVSLCELTASQPFACVSIVIKWWPLSTTQPSILQNHHPFPINPTVTLHPPRLLLLLLLFLAQIESHPFSAQLIIDLPPIYSLCRIR